MGNIIKTIVIGAVAALAIITVAGCETTSSRPYTVSTQNVMAFQEALDDTKVSVGTFSTAADVDANMTCRALGALEVAPGKTPVEFIEGAFRDELFAAGAMDTNGTAIKGTVKELDFNSMGTGSWNIVLNLASDKLPDGYDVSTAYSFKTSFSAISACQNVIDAFTPAVQELISTAIADPKFSDLTG